MSSNLSNSVFSFQWRLSRLQHWPQCTFSAWALVHRGKSCKPNLTKKFINGAICHQKLHVSSRKIAHWNKTFISDLYLYRIFPDTGVLLCCCVFWCILCFNLRNITSNLLVTNVGKCNFCFIRFATSFQINWTRNAIQQQHTYTHLLHTVLDLDLSKPLWPSFRVSLVCWFAPPLRFNFSIHPHETI